MHEQLRIEKPPSKWRRRLVVAVAGLVLLFGGGLFLMLLVGRGRLSEAMAKTDRLDPGWRLEDLEARREVIPDSENSANTVIAVEKIYPKLWPAWECFRNEEPEELPKPSEEALPPPEGLPPPVVVAVPPDVVDSGPQGQETPLLDANTPEVFARGFSEQLGLLPPNRRYSAEQAIRIQHELIRAADTLELARTLAHQPRGRHPINYTPDWISTLLPTIQGTRSVASLLSYDVGMRAHEGDLTGSLESCLAILNSGRSMGDEPMLITMLVRMAIESITLGRLERILGQGEPAVADLEKFQKLLLEEADVPLFLIAMRGERAGVDRFFQAIENGTISYKQLQGLFRSGPGAKANFSVRDLTDIYIVKTPGVLQRYRAKMLEHMTEAVEIAKLPLEEQQNRYKTWEKTIANSNPFIRELSPAISKVQIAMCRTRGMLRAGVVAMAAERYRRDQGRWPARLEDLVPIYLAEVPRDPFDNQPIRYRHDPEGVVIYSTGMDGKDNGGVFETLNTHKPGTDAGFRLWHPGHRGLPQEPTPPAAPPQNP